MKKHIVSTLLFCAIGHFCTQGAWDIVSTFDDASALDKVTDLTNIEASNARSEIVDGKWAVYPGDLFEATSNLYAALDLGVDLRAASRASGGPVTVYLEIVQPNVPDGAGGTRKAIVDTVWGVSNFPPSEILTTRFNSYNAMQRINGGTDGFEGRNGTAYEAIDLFNANVTYKIWLVIDFNLNFYEAYIQGGQWASQTKINTIDTSGIWLFRANPGADVVVQYFLVALSRGNAAEEKGIDPTYFDNIAVDTTGQNLTTPVVANGNEWCGITKVGGDVDTGDFMGWIWVGDATGAGWVYSYSLDGFVYVSACPDASGAWIYILNN